MRFFLAVLNILLTICIFISVTGFILWLKNLQDQISKEIPNYSTEKVLTMEDAEFDFKENSNSGILTAFCDQQKTKGNDFKSLKFSNGGYLCEELYEK